MTGFPGDMSSQPLPVWLVALVLAVASPVLVRLYADHLERQTAQRTRLVVARLAKATAADAAAETANDADDAEVDEVKGTPHDG